MKTAVLKSLETSALKTNVSTHTYSPLTTGETLHFSCVIKIYDRLGEIPATRGAARRDVSCRDEARRGEAGGGGGARVWNASFLLTPNTSDMVGKSSPYKLVYISPN